jgi:hypothetical protein
MKNRFILTQNYLIAAIVVVGIVMTSTIAFGQEEWTLGTGEKGKMTQREMESFLKPKPAAPSVPNTTGFQSTRGNDPNLMGNNLLGTGEYGKMPQREMESFLKPKPATPSEAIEAKELSPTQEVIQIPSDQPKGPALFNYGGEKWPWLNNR